MNISVFDLFSIGVGPSSSHTVGPMRAGYIFSNLLLHNNQLHEVHHLNIELFGSLALTGKGHCTDSAILMGLEGKQPQSIDPDIIVPRMQYIREQKTLLLCDQHCIPFDINTQMIFHIAEQLPKHSNGMRFTALDTKGEMLLQKIYYSVGGGFVTGDDVDDGMPSEHAPPEQITSVPFPFSTAKELFAHCRTHNLKIHEVMLENESTWRSKKDVHKELFHIYRIMTKVIKKGCRTPGILPGGLNIHRRAPTIIYNLKKHKKFRFRRIPDMQWLDAFALAVSEENASGGRVVTAPTNGSAGIIPAVLHYHKTFQPNVGRKQVVEFLLTAGAIGILYKLGASLSGAEVGCQGEVGVACSMASAALAAAYEGSLEQIEDAAEIGMEHHLGLTCDPVAGLVQIPCIERNAIAAVTAVNVANLVMTEYRTNQLLSLDNIIATMKQTGLDMNSKYKETSLGGLATHCTIC